MNGSQCSGGGLAGAWLLPQTLDLFDTPSRGRSWSRRVATVLLGIDLSMGVFLS